VWTGGIENARGLQSEEICNKSVYLERFVVIGCAKSEDDNEEKEMVVEDKLETSTKSNFGEPVFVIAWFAQAGDCRRHLI